MAIKKELDYAVHPGIIIKEFLKNIGMKQKELASKLNVQPSIVSEIIKGKRSVSVDYAVKLEPIFGLPASFWTKTQCDYDVYIKKEKIISTSENIYVDDYTVATKAYKPNDKWLYAA